MLHYALRALLRVPVPTPPTESPSDEQITRGVIQPG